MKKQTSVIFASADPRPGDLVMRMPGFKGPYRVKTIEGDGAILQAKLNDVVVYTNFTPIPINELLVVG
jgi:hypothetical protein